MMQIAGDSVLSDPRGNFERYRLRSLGRSAHSGHSVAEPQPNYLPNDPQISRMALIQSAIIRGNRIGLTDSSSSAKIVAKMSG
jgi:hypothetical protein